MSSFEPIGHEVIEPGSPRSFGLTFAVAFAVLGVVAGLSAWPAWMLYASGLLSAGFLVAAFVAPNALVPLNRLWFKFGLLLSKLTQPIILGILFFGVVTPIGIVRRILGNDRLQLKRPASSGYWIDRDTVSDGEGAADMRRQF